MYFMCVCIYKYIACVFVCIYVYYVCVCVYIYICNVFMGVYIYIYIYISSPLHPGNQVAGPHHQPEDPHSS